MLARAPGDVAHADVAQAKTYPVARAFTPRGNGAVFPATPGANARGGPANARDAAYSVQISQRRAAGMRDDLCKQALDTIDDVIGSVIRRDRLGGLLHEYAQVA